MKSSLKLCVDDLKSLNLCIHMVGELDHVHVDSGCDDVILARQYKLAGTVRI